MIDGMFALGGFILLTLFFWLPLRQPSLTYRFNDDGTGRDS